MWWICGLPFFLSVCCLIWRWMCTLHSSFIFNGQWARINPTDFCRTLKRDESQHTKKTQCTPIISYTFSPSLQCWFFGFCSSQDLLYRQVVNLSLFVWLILVFCSFFRFATDSVCTMRFLFRMVFVCVTAIGFDFWGCLKHMDHRYVHLWVSFYGFICFCLGFLFMVH